MKQILFTLALFVPFLFSCAQQKNAVKGYAFFKESIPGREPRDIEGNPIARPRDTLHLVYLELNDSGTHRVDSVSYYGKNAPAALYRLGRPEFFIGNLKNDGSRVELQPRPGKSWWRVELSTEEIRGVGRKGKIVVRGTEGGKPFVVELDRETELEPDQRG
jgi:hypothetical protein